ncbi:unnamed protein product [Ixodes hexagonus]
MVMAEGEPAKSGLTSDSSFRKTLYALEQWPGAIESLRHEQHSPAFVASFCGLLDRTLSELEVIASLMDKQARRQGEPPKEPSKEAPSGDPTPPDQPDPAPPVKKARMKYTPLRKLSV